MSKEHPVLTQEQVDQILQPLENTRAKIGGECLMKALEIINGKRRDNYGTPEDSFNRIADYWNNYLRHMNLLNTDANILSKDVAMMMVLFKIARLENGYTKDSCIDICGYTAIYDDFHKNSEVE